MTSPSPTPAAPDPLHRLHVITHLDWQREGERSFEQQRADLLDTLARLTALMQSESGTAPPLRHVLLGGQTILLEDIAAVRASLVALLAIYNAGGRLSVGPWYILTDSLLVSDEALVRNLLLGRLDTQRQGMKRVHVALMPAGGHQTAQLPQLLRGFGITAALVYAPVQPLPLRWIAPDESDVLVLPYQPADTVAQTLARQQSAQPDGPFLWLNPCDPPGRLVPDLRDQVSVPVIQSTLSDYVQALRDSFPDGMRPALHGEMQLQPPGAGSGRFSARMPLKQHNAALQNRLVFTVEPLLALALTHGRPAHPENLRALLEYAWRRLLTNQAQSLIGGACSDSVYEDMQTRYRQVQDVATRLEEGALRALPGTPAHAAAVLPRAAETFVLVWNPHSQPVQQVVAVTLALPAGLHPHVLLDAAGQEIPCALEGDRLIFRAAAPPVGYAVYTLRLGEQPVPQYRLQRTATSASIGSINHETLSFQEGRLLWEQNGHHFSDLLQFYSGGDAGDVTQYRAPQPDLLVRAAAVDSVEIEATAVYERLIVRHRMRLPPGLQDGRRERGVRLLELVTTATCYDSTPGIYFRTSFTNNIGDHRLRAQVRTGLRAGALLVDAPFALLRRPLFQPGAAALQPMHSLCAIPAETTTLALLTRGLPEVEPLNLDGQITLALTLLRPVGWLNPAQTLAAPGAQHQHDIRAEFMLTTVPAAEPAGLLRLAQQYRAPLQAFQYHQKPPADRHSYLNVSDARVLLTALKPPQDARGWIIRLLNPTATSLTTQVETAAQPISARLVSLAETDSSELELRGRQFTVSLAPHQIVTLHVQFEEAANP